MRSTETIIGDGRVVHVSLVTTGRASPHGRVKTERTPIASAYLRHGETVTVVADDGGTGYVEGPGGLR